MKILAIETSCDETAIALLDCTGSIVKPKFKVLEDVLHSQTKLHEQYGGVFPMMAKRSHTENIIPLLLSVLKIKKIETEVKLENSKIKEKIKKILEKDRGLFEIFEKYIFSIKKPKIDAITVTEGPGLEPTLWVGINFAKALGLLWNIPVFGVDHMQGHFFSVLLNRKKMPLKYPALALLVSGGHTELVLSKKPLKYEVLGKTRDDAVGEAFDKVARILGLPYPGGPQISKFAEIARKEKLSKNLIDKKIILPRPMIHSKDLDFSFSGIKTAVLYLTQKLGKIDGQVQKEIACEFEEAVVEVLVSKTSKAIETHNPKTLIVAGGVSANKYLKNEINKLQKTYPDLQILFPDKKLTGDNAIMIGMAGYLAIKAGQKSTNKMVAQGNLKISD